MRETYKGLASGIVYASKGDLVNVIRVEDKLTFVEFNGEKFHVQSSLLSETKIDIDKEVTEPAVVKSQVRTNNKKTSKSYSQSQFF